MLCPQNPLSYVCAHHLKTTNSIMRANKQSATLARLHQHVFEHTFTHVVATYFHLWLICMNQFPLIYLCICFLENMHKYIILLVNDSGFNKGFDEQTVVITAVICYILIAYRRTCTAVHHRMFWSCRPHCDCVVKHCGRCQIHLWETKGWCSCVYVRISSHACRL